MYTYISNNYISTKTIGHICDGGGASLVLIQLAVLIFTKLKTYHVYNPNNLPTTTDTHKFSEVLNSRRELADGMDFGNPPRPSL